MEPERKIETLLRGFAKRRREQAGEPLELHPANRRLLQKEIRKQSAEKEDRGSLFHLCRVQPVLFGLAVLVAMGLLAAMLLPFVNRVKSKGQLASKELVDTSSAAGEIPPASTPMPLSAPMVGGVEEDRARQWRALTGGSDAPLTEADRLTIPGFGAANQTSAGVVYNQSVSNARDGSVDQSAFGRGVSMTNSIAMTSSFGGLAAGRTSPATGTSVLKFEQVAQDKFAQKPVSVLTLFDVEQSGSHLRITDSDGSIYESTNALFESHDVSINGSAKTIDNITALADVITGETKKLPFQLVGTNRTLHQDVFFAGTLYYSTNAQSKQTNISVGGAGLAGEPASSSLAIRLEGTVIVGRTNQFQLEAKPTGSPNR